MSNLEFSKEVEDLLKFDREHLWHPYTSMVNPLTVYPVESAKGCLITLDTNSEQKYSLIEAMSSWWCMIHGYNNEEINEAMIQQIRKVSHVMFGGLTHKPAITLAQKVLNLLEHHNLQKVFFADTGSVAVEVAMKMALQYEYTLSNGKTNKRKFLTIKKGYHGDTFGAMSVCDPVNSMHSLYKGYLTENIFVDAPSNLNTLPTSHVAQTHSSNFSSSTQWNSKDFKEFENAVRENHDNICAVILEPLLQGAGGMRLYHPQYLIEVRKCCNEYNVPLIFDEIATGFGRTGEMFAFHHCKRYQDLQGIPTEEQVDVYPDIICLGKSLTGGYMTLSAVVTTSRISDGISSPKSPTGGCFMHGPTFMANPLACSAANKSVDILMRGLWKNQVQNIETQFFEELYLPVTSNKILMERIVGEVRVCGAICIVEFLDKPDVAWLQDQFIVRKVYVRPFNKLCYVMPPYVISREELTTVCTAIKSVLHLMLDQKLYLK